MLFNYDNHKSMDGIDYFSNTFGIVIKTEDEIGFQALGVRVDKLFPGLNTDENVLSFDNTINLKTDKIENIETLKLGSDTVNSRNYLIVQPQTLSNMRMAKYSLGEKVKVSFEDNDIKSVSFIPYSINQPEIRNTDIQSFFVSSKANTNDFTVKENSYYVELNSVNQYIQLHTSNANGEESQLDLIFDAKNGIITLTDGNGLLMSVNSKEDAISLVTSSGGSFNLKEKKLSINVDELDLQINKKTTITSPDNDFTLDKVKLTSKNVEEKIDTLSTESKKINISTTNYTLESTAISTFKSKSAFHNSKIVGFSGPVILPGYSFGTVTSPPSSLPISSSGGVGNQSQGIDTGFGIPLVKAQPLIVLLNSMAAIIDSKLAPGAQAVAAVNAAASSLLTTRIKSN